MKLLKLLFILTITQIAAPLGIGLALEQEAPLKEKVSFLSCNFQDSCIQAITRGDQETAEFAGMCRAGSGNLVNQLCSMDNAIGRCVVAHEKTTYIHYETKDHLEQVKNSCALASGTWHNLVFKEQAAEEAKSFYEKSMATKNHERTFLGRLADLASWILVGEQQPTPESILKGQHGSILRNEQQSRATHADWMGKIKLEVHREIFEQLAKSGGGCGTLSTFLCAQRLGAGIDLTEIDRAFLSKPRTSNVERRAFFTSKGYCSLRSDLQPNCSSYQSMQTWLERGCSIEVTMINKNGEGHVEFLNNAGFYKDLCWGITNSWGEAAIIEGGYGWFYHSSLPMFNGHSEVAFTKICPCTDKNVSSLVGEFVESLGRSDSAFIRASNLLSGIDLLLKYKTPKEVEKTFRNNRTNLNKVNETGDTPLTLAITFKEIEAVRILANAGADLNEANYSKETPLVIAVKQNSADIVQILTNAGADLNNDYWWGNTPLYVAVFLNSADIAQILIKAGADINKKGEGGKVPLLRAVELNEADIVQILVNAGANINAVTPLGETPLEIAREHKYREIIQILEKARERP